VRTEQATFDNVIGEVRCPGVFEVETTSMEFPGRGFTMLVNDQGERVELTVEVEHVEHVRLARRPRTADRGAAGGDARADGAPAPKRPAQGTPAPRDAGPPQFYRLTLHDQVRIRQGPAPGRRTATGDALTIVFSAQSEGLGPSLAFAPGRGCDVLTDPGCHALSAQRQSMRLAQRLSLALFALPDQAIAPAPSDDDIIITCASGLTMVPVTDPAEMLDTPDDARLTLTGQPVELRDADQDARAECDRLIYGAREQKVELVGSASRPVSVAAPRLVAEGELFWISKSRGGFTGPGWLETRRQPETVPQGEPAPEASRLRVRWTEGVDLAFDEPAGDEALGDLRRADCRGEVAAADAERTIWSDGLGVVFAQAPAPTDADVQQVTAAGDVQILLANGARVFADELVGDPAAGTVLLTGANLAIAHDQWLIDGGRRLALDQQTEIADWQGPGRARRFAAALPVAGERRVARPARAVEPEAQLRWSGSMRYDRSDGDGAGAIELHGGVSAVSEPHPLEQSTLAARELTLALAPDDPAESAGANRRLGRIIARGDAQLERRNWLSPDRSDDPRIFFLAGQQIEYDDQTGEGVVDGAGDLLIRDPRTDESSPDTPLGARGTTAFRWQRKLQLKRREATLYEITMLDGIEMRHRSPDLQTATLTCARLDATIDRAATEPGAAPAGDPIGGPAELKRLRAEGKVFLHTPQRDVDCDLFDYDVARGVAELSARPGSTVTVMTAGAPQPVRIERAMWDLTRDELTVLRGTGGGAP
jgi:hypothetical protein